MHGSYKWGNVGRLSGAQGSVDFDSGDVTTLLGAATGLVRALVAFAGLAIAVELLGALIGGVDQRGRRARQISLGSGPAFVEDGYSREFWGTILDTSLTFHTGDDEIDVPVDSIYEITVSKGELNLKLTDGSRFRDVRLVRPTTIRFMTLGGIQTVTPERENPGCLFALWANEHSYAAEQRISIKGAWVSDTAEQGTVIRDNIREVVTRRADDIVAILGPQALPPTVQRRFLPPSR